MSADQDAVNTLVTRLDAEARARLGRSLAVFVVTAGDCGGCALEVALMRGLAAHGLALAPEPSGADVLLVSGVITHSLVRPVQLALDAMARPRWVVAVGGCAIDGGPFAGGYAVAGGVSAAVPVDLVVPGCPPSPDAVLAGLLTVLAANG